MKSVKVRVNKRNTIYVVSTPEEHPVTTTDAEIDAAIAKNNATPPSVTAQKAEYEPATDKVRVSFDNGSDVGFPRARLQGLEHAMVEQLVKIEIEGPGTGLFWPALDVAHYIPALLDGIYGTRSWMAALGKKGGSASSVAKATAARANGQKGGRPSLTSVATAASKSRVTYAAKKSAGKGGGRKKRSS